MLKKEKKKDCKTKTTMLIYMPCRLPRGRYIIFYFPILMGSMFLLFRVQRPEPSYEKIVWQQ